MKVVIGCLNSKYIHASLSPWCLLAGAREFCKKEHEVEVCEFTINGDIQKFANELICKKAELYAFSAYIWNIEKTLELAREIKSQLDCKIVLGGPEVSFRGRKVLCEYDFIDYVLAGEGEYNFPELLDADVPSSVSGLFYRDGESILQNAEKPALGTPPSPYLPEFFEHLKGRICYIETSRGCPYRCAFCLSGRCSPLRFFELEGVKKDIILLANSGTQTIKFVDRTFNSNEKRANEIISFILKNYGNAIPDGVCFHFEIAGDILKESTLKILERMPVGAVQLEIGMQSFNGEVLKTINRKTDTKKLIQNIKRLVSFGNMHIHIDLIAGLTGEDIKSFENSFNIGYSLGANMLQLGFLKLLFGADMRENPEKFPCRFNSEPPYEVIETPWISESELEKIHLCEDALERTYNSGRFLETLKLLGVGEKISAFEFFSSLGEKLRGEGMPLKKYAEELFLALKTDENEAELRDAMIFDLICSGNFLHIPDILKTPDPRLSKIKASLSRSGAPIKFAILYNKRVVISCDYSSERDLFGRFSPSFSSL